MNALTRSSLLAALAVLGCRQFPESNVTSDFVEQGREIFRHETFGNERFWTDTARLHEVIEDDVGAFTALDLGLKVDADKIQVLGALKHPLGGVGLTKELLKADAVVGLKAKFDDKGRIVEVGITCALCHSTVDGALAPGMGNRLDGWPNRDLEIGKILALLPVFTEQQKATLRTWPKGTYDPRFNFDGKSTPLVLPPAYGLAHVRNETYTAEGPISYWNAYVAVTQMHGQGVFKDERLGINVSHSPDLVTPRLAALSAYQHSIPAPEPPPQSYDRGDAEKGWEVFKANCARCHVNGNSTDNNYGVLHEPAETGMDGAYARRTANKKYRTTPLRGLWQHPPYFHDGSAKTLEDVIEHYDRVLNLRLSGEQKKHLEQYLRSL